MLCLFLPCLQSKQLTEYKKIGSTDSGSVMYNRVFLDKETRELRLYGLNGNGGQCGEFYFMQRA